MIAFFRTTLILFFLIHLSGKINAQEHYWVFFTDKNDVNFDPHSYFDQKAIDRRAKNNISLYDKTDYPLNQHYVEMIASKVINLRKQIRWINAVSVQANPDQIAEINTLPFVAKTSTITQYSTISATKIDTFLTDDEQQLLTAQIEHMQGNLFAEKGYNGKGIRIAIFDAGFPTVDVNPAFEHIRKNKRIIKTWDFARNKENVYANNIHGTMVMSCIAGMVGDKKLGLATDAEFLLARTEINTEKFKEEENWLAAVEWADKNGADIINSSLGYTHDRYFKYQMDGETSLVSRAANMAASKGILVVNAIGNDGGNEWKILGAPADADSVLSIGGINPVTLFHTSFSSFGPTADNRLKPNLVAFGHAIVAKKYKLAESQGTSFAAPLVAGFAACAWQAKPELTGMEMFKEMEQIGNLAPYFDYAHGYGVPSATKFFDECDLDTISPIQFETSNGYLNILIDKNFIDKKSKTCNNYLFYHIEDNEHVLAKYWLIDVYQREAAKISFSELKKGNIIRAHYKGYTLEYVYE